MVSNRKIDAFILSTEFLIDIDYGIKALHKYIHDLELISSGISIKELGYNNDPSLNVSIIGPNGQVSQEVDLNHSIAKVRLSGVMRMDDGLCSSGIQTLSEQIKALDRNPNIDGFVFDVNSGGGESTAGVHLYNTIKDLRKPSVAQTHIMASAAYLAMLPVNEIIAMSTMSYIGSIGALVTIDRKFVQYYAERFDEVYSSKSENKNEEYRAYLDGDKSKLIKSLDGLVDEFHAKVVMHRELNPDYKKETLSGKMFYAKEAKSRGLIDSIGTEAYALQRIKSYIKNQK